MAFVLKKMYKTVLKRVLGKYLTDELDVDQFDVNLIAGSLILNTLDLNIEEMNSILENMKTPFRFTSCMVDHFELKIPSLDGLLSEGCNVTVAGVEANLILFEDDQDDKLEKTNAKRENTNGVTSKDDNNNNNNSDGNNNNNVTSTGEGLSDLTTLIERIASKINLTITDVHIEIHIPKVCHSLIIKIPGLYSYDEEVDDPKDIKRKKLALKEQVANAKSHLDGQKSKYYAEVKAGSRLAPEQQKAVDFFNRYNEDAKAIEKNKSVFEKRTNDVFNNEFKGFEYNVGEKRFRLNIKEADKVKDNQMNINNFVSKFTNKQTQEVDDAKGYHKSLFTAMNPDLVANHFYQQGKADAIKDSMAKAKNVDMSANSTHPDVVESGGMKVRAISGNSSNDFKVKIGRNPNKIS